MMHCTAPSSPALWGILGTTLAENEFANAKGRAATAATIGRTAAVAAKIGICHDLIDITCRDGGTADSAVEFFHSIGGAGPQNVCVYLVEPFVAPRGEVEMWRRGRRCTRIALLVAASTAAADDKSWRDTSFSVLFRLSFSLFRQLKGCMDGRIDGWMNGCMPKGEIQRLQENMVLMMKNIFYRCTVLFPFLVQSFLGYVRFRPCDYGLV